MTTTRGECDFASSRAFGEGSKAKVLLFAPASRKSVRSPDRPASLGTLCFRLAPATGQSPLRFLRFAPCPEGLCRAAGYAFQG